MKLVESSNEIGGLYSETWFMISMKLVEPIAKLVL